MAEGKNKIARSLLDLQPTAILDFYQIYPDIVNHPTLSINIHAGSVFGEHLIWQGVKYDPIPIECEGFEVTSSGKLPRPKIRIANKDFLVTKLLQDYNDLKNGQIIRKRTFLKYIDDVNFDGGNPFGDADSTAEISEEKYVIGQKTQESKVLVELELTSPLDLENFEVNHRRILGKYCYWQYRGHGCRYRNEPIERENGEPFKDPTGGYVVPNLTNFNSSDPNYLWSDTKEYEVSDIAFISNPNIRIQISENESQKIFENMKTWYVCVSGNSGERPEDNPTYWQKDGCTKKLSACKKRFLDGEHEGYITAERTIEKDYIEFTGAGRHETASTYGYFFSDEPQLTGFFTGDFTIALYLEPENNIQNLGKYFDTFTGDSNLHGLGNTNAYGLGNRAHDQTVDGQNLSLSYPSSTEFHLFGMNAGSLGRTAIFLQHDRSKNALYVKSTVDKGYVVTNYEVENSSAFTWNANAFVIGARTSKPVLSSAIAPETVDAKYYNVAVWDKVLDDSKLANLLTFEKDSSNSRFIQYDDMFFDLEHLNLNSGLIAWYQNTGNDGGYDVFQDSHTSQLDLTGSGNYKLDTENYKTKVLEPSLELPNDKNYLPFGGFVGTDGFSYQQ